MGHKKQVKFKLTNPIHLLAIGFGSGLSPIMPGTMGTIAAVFIWYLSLQSWSLSVFFVLIVVACIPGIYLCDKTANDIGIHDHGSIVWDEFVGMWLVLVYLPVMSWQWILIAFMLFRFFDMLKPFPIRWFDRRIPGGLGIMLDDIIAAILAILVMLIVKMFI